MHSRGAVALSAALLASVSAQSDEEALVGFSPARSASQRALEARFDALLRAGNLREWMRRMSARPHAVGQPWGRENAEFIAGLFRSWGYDTTIEEFQVLFPRPTVRVLEMVAPTAYRARLAEPPLREDATSGQTGEQLPVYNAYSVDGDVTGELVYVNYGVPADYEELDRRGIDVKGRIVIARYGGSWRGIKPKVAAEHGAVGCLIYSDPRDDGYFQGDVYPAGPYRNDQGAQRGSVADMPLFPGDPLTPGVGATRDAKRLPVREAPTLTKIPVMPISYADALPLLRAMGGPVAPEAWRGALPITYHLGPGPARVHLKLAFEWKLAPAYDVIARLAGAESPDVWILRGNHHDAWVNGAEDPVSGMVALLEEARAVAELRKQGFTPRRTIVYAAWDAEEPGLLGSTEWVETHADELRGKAAVYINTDGNSRGFLQAGGSHTLEALVAEVARDVPDPRKGVSVGERLRARRLVRGSPEEKKRAAQGDVGIEALGSGSDYTPFLQHLGIASLNVAYGGEGDGGSYHSIYDSFDHYTRFLDPGFDYGLALVRTAGRLTLRLADADVLPFEFTRFADTVSRYVDDVARLGDEMREKTEEQNRLLREGRLQADADPLQPWVPPTPRPPVPHINLTPLRNALSRVRESALAYDRARAAAWKDGTPTLSAEELRALDAVLFRTERALTRPEGLPGRPWYVHQVYAPGFYTGYGVKTLPGVREAFEQRDWARAEEQAQVTARALLGFADEVDRAARLLSAKEGR